jgi:hypothetical protein
MSVTKCDIKFKNAYSGKVQCVINRTSMKNIEEPTILQTEAKSNEMTKYD